MRINVIRGQNQIGGSIIEVASSDTKIILDLGGNMHENRQRPYVPSISGLFQGSPAFAGIFISHYHFDHAGLVKYACRDIPVYMGAAAYSVLKAEADAKGKILPFTPNLLGPGVPVTLGDLKVTPIACDHSAWGSLMFLIDSRDQSVLYTGDFRSTGRMDFSGLLTSLPKADALICEGTTLSRAPGEEYPTEQALEDRIAEILTKKSGPGFIYLSPMNPERILTAARGAARSGRRFIAGKQVSAVAKAAGLEVEIFHRREFLARSASNRPSPDFLMCVSPGLWGSVEKLRNRLSFRDGVFIFSRREETMVRPAPAMLIANFRRRGVPLEHVHTSGHASPEALDMLINALGARYLIPVHTKNAAWFSRYEQGCDVIFNCRDFEF